MVKIGDKFHFPVDLSYLPDGRVDPSVKWKPFTCVNECAHTTRKGVMMRLAIVEGDCLAPDCNAKAVTKVPLHTPFMSRAGKRYVIGISLYCAYHINYSILRTQPTGGKPGRPVKDKTFIFDSAKVFFRKHRTGSLKDITAFILSSSSASALVSAGIAQVANREKVVWRALMELVRKGEVEETGPKNARKYRLSAMNHDVDTDEINTSVLTDDEIEESVRVETEMYMKEARIKLAGVSEDQFRSGDIDEIMNLLERLKTKASFKERCDMFNFARGITFRLPPLPFHEYPEYDG